MNSDCVGVVDVCKRIRLVAMYNTTVFVCFFSKLLLKCSVASDCGQPGIGDNDIGDSWHSCNDVETFVENQS